MRYFLATILLSICCSLPTIAQSSILSQFKAPLRYNEGLVVYKNRVLASNFGTNELDPLTDEGKGYIVSISGNDIKMFIPADGYMSAPKGMAVHAHHLFVADVGKVLVYNLKKLKGRVPQVIKFPKGEDFVNDIAVIGDIVLVTVTNTGNIYGLDATDITNIGEPKLMGNVPGANGITVGDGYIYYASFNPNGEPTAANVIYYADIIANNGVIDIKPLIANLEGGQYDGITLSEDGQALYFSSWTGENGHGTLYRYELSGDLPVRKIDFGVPFGGPADICIFEGMLYIPDMPNSTLYRFAL